MNALFGVLEVLAGVLVITGGVFCLTGSIGLLRLPTFFARLHGPGKASTLGVLCILLAAMLFPGGPEQGFALRELLISAFIAITAPVSTYMLGKAAVDRRLPGTTPTDPAP